MVTFADQLIHRLELLQPDPGSLLVIRMPEDNPHWNTEGLSDLVERFGIEGVVILPPGARLDFLTPQEKRRLARRWLDEDVMIRL